MSDVLKRRKLTFFQRIALESLWFFCRAFAMTPYWFRYYVTENLIYVILYLMRYRMKVVKTNLRNSFPEKSERELNIIRRRFYRTLAEIFVDTFSLAGLSNEQCRRVVVCRNAEQHKAEVNGRDWIAMTAHFGCWEYCSFWGLIDPSQVVVAVYHPLRNQIFEHLYKRLRKRENTLTVAMKESVRFYMRHSKEGVDGKNLVMGLIADQNPPRRPDSHWFRFLNQDTLFFDGGEKLALKYNLPVYFAHMKRVKRGYYELTFERIYDGQEPVADYEITERYVRRLEAMIRDYPELWMWSHRRWKHKSPADLARIRCMEQKS